MSFLGQVSLGHWVWVRGFAGCGLRGLRCGSIGPTIIHCDDKFHLGHGKSVMYQDSDGHETRTQAAQHTDPVDVMRSIRTFRDADV